LIGALGHSPTSDWRAEKAKMPGSTEAYTWIWVDASYLREQAQRCIRLARGCPHSPTAHQIEAIGVELMEKAAELDQLEREPGGETWSKS